MIEAIALLRRTADECERKARNSDSAGVVKAEMIDIAGKWHWLAAKAAALCARSKQLNGDDGVACARCLEKCVG